MKKQYRLKDGVDFEELEKYGYSPCYGSLYKDYTKTVNRTKRTISAAMIKNRLCENVFDRDPTPNRRVYIIDASPNNRRFTFVFGKNELPYIQDLLDAGLVEEVEA